MNIKLSLTIRFLIIAALLLTAFSLVIYENYSNFRKVDYQERLAERTASIASVLLDVRNPDSVSIMMARDNNLRLMPFHKVSVYNSRFMLVTDPTRASRNITTEILNDIRQKKHTSFALADTQFVGFVMKHKDADYLVVGSALDLVGRKKADYLLQVIIISLLLSLVVTAALGWLFASQALKPIKRVIDEVDQLTAHNLHKRLPVNNTDDEISALSNTFNKMLDRLEASFVMQKNFVSNASHEFRTPITAIKAQIEVMLMQERSKEEYINTMKSIDEDIDHFIKLMQSLGELAKANVDILENKQDRVPLIEIVAESRAELLRGKPRYRIDLNIENLPESEHENYVEGNASLLKSAFKNLMENACKFSPELKCQATVLFVNGNILITVTDEGIGIPAEELPHIFEPFYRANDTRGISGHGIGLSLVKKIIDLHNGDISVESTPSIGTRMMVRLPHVSLG